MYPNQDIIRCILCFLLVVLDEVLTGHVGGLLHSEDVEDRGSHVSEASVLYSSRVVVSNVDERNRIQ